MKTPFDFTARRVLMTGGTLGIGRAAARAFLAVGATVAINGPTATSVLRTIRELGGGARLIAAPGDLSITDERQRTVATALADLGGLDILVNIAGRGDIRAVGDVTEDYWQGMMDRHLKSAFFTAQACVSALRATRGNIINVSSALGLIGGPPGSVVYATANGALVQMTRMMALALAPDGIRVNALCPGWVEEAAGEAAAGEEDAAGESALYENYPIPCGRAATAEEAVGAMLYLGACSSSYTTGAILSIDGGLAAGH